MKKLLTTLLISLLVIASMLTGCGAKPAANSTSSNENVEISFWHGYTPEKEAFLKEMIGRYEKDHPNVKITPKFVASGEAMLQKVQASVLSGDVPDILWGFPTWTGVLSSSGKIKDVGALMDDKMKKDIFPGLLDAGTLDGKIYSLPIEAGALVLIYNKDMFAEAGIKNPPTSWDELLKTAQALTNKNHYGIWLPIKPDERTTWTWETFLWQNGGQLLSKDGKSVEFGSEKGLEALKLYGQFVQGKLSPIDADPDPFISKQAAMIIGTQGAAAAYINKNKMNVGVADLPKKETMGTGLGSNHLFLFKTTDKKEKAAWDFCKWLVSADNNAEWAIKQGYLPVSNSAVGSQTYKKYGQENPYMLTAANALQYAVTRPSIEAYPKISSAISEAIGNVVYNKKTAEDALKEAVDKSKQALNK